MASSEGIESSRGSASISQSVDTPDPEPQLTPAAEPETQDSKTPNDTSQPRRRLLRRTNTGERHIRLAAPPIRPGGRQPGSTSSIYLGSFTPRRSKGSLSGSVKSPSGSAPGTPRHSIATSISQVHLEAILQDLNLDLETYGVEERRDGFFDGAFFKPAKTNFEDLMRAAEFTLPETFRKNHPLSPRSLLPKQWHDIKSVISQVATTRAGIKLTKTFLAFLISYILCLVPVVSSWLGRYSYIFVLSTIINHPGRTVGAQLEGALFTSLGSASGLGWGAFALWLSTSTSVVRRGYGGVLATFLLLFMVAIAALRSYYIRMYQFVLCSGIAIIYTCLADTSRNISWSKLFDFGIPWLFGQALCLIICCAVFPDAGARPLAVSLHAAFGVMQEGLVIPQSQQFIIHRRLAMTFVNLSQAYRDLVLDISFTRFPPKDVESLRNLMQAVIRSLLSLKMETLLFDNLQEDEIVPQREAGLRTSILDPGKIDMTSSDSTAPVDPGPVSGESVIDIDSIRRPAMSRTDSEDKAVKLVVNKLADPTSKLLACMRSALRRCDAVLMDMSGYRVYLGPPKSVSTDILDSLTRLRKTMIKYDEEEDSLLENPALPPSYSNQPEVVELFLFVHPVRQAASTVEALLVKVMEMQQSRRGWRPYLPSYPLSKALQRTNAAVRHDRGGLTAGYYFRSQSQLAKIMKGMANVYKPLPRQSSDPSSVNDPREDVTRMESMGKYEEEEDIAMNRSGHASKQKRLRYRIWMILHRLQGFESRFALKVGIVTSLLAVPAWLGPSRGWWNENESWWAVVVVWIMMHPRVGGNFQDLVTRAFCGILGAIWGGLTYGARSGNPYAMAVMASIFMLPMLYRFTQSSHPRSGIVGCISFVVVSLDAYKLNGQPSIERIAWTRGVAILVGVVSAVVMNWILWPFVARHELRKALSAMMIYSSIIYRGVVAKYVYYEEGEPPNKQDIERSEMLEGRLREGFVRIRQLLALTRHEIRLRGPFNPLPYSALIDGCERFFEYLVSVRQAAIFFHPHYMTDNDQAAESLLAYRRDAVATVLMNLYVLAGALRGDCKVPRYLPSAAAARKRLLDHMAELEVQQPTTNGNSRATAGADARKWSQIYSYSYSQSLTGCVQQLEQLQKYTKEIVGEQGFDPD
ncbi:putative BRE4 [Coleophoma crateriformis]|uniref:Putative BRE4 n=1 Tax=Coleophoma crateriformis TaxID=565419 RepID=A0A3D8RDM3_9HELO|nr:putative BRE4 [Coleophoma crateriformis]